jgi:hypothetical protein
LWCVNCLRRSHAVVRTELLSSDEPKCAGCSKAGHWEYVCRGKLSCQRTICRGCGEYCSDCKLVYGGYSENRSLCAKCGDSSHLHTCTQTGCENVYCKQCDARCGVCNWTPEVQEVD